MEIDKVKELIELMVENDLQSISIRNGSEEITLRRPDACDVAGRQAVLSNHRNDSAPAFSLPDVPEVVETAAADESVTIVSPMVGTFYSSPHPGAPPFIQVGSVVTNDTIVGIIEAMKVFNEIPAEISGTIDKILVTNEQAVEFGQPLFSVRSSQ